VTPRRKFTAGTGATSTAGLSDADAARLAELVDLPDPEGDDADTAPAANAADAGGDDSDRWPTDETGTVDRIHVRALADVVDSFSYADLRDADDQLVVHVHRGAVARGDRADAYREACAAHERLDQLAGEVADAERETLGEPDGPTANADAWAALSWTEKADRLADRLATLREADHGGGDDGLAWDDPGTMFADGGVDVPDDLGALAALTAREGDGTDADTDGLSADLSALTARVGGDVPRVQMSPQQVRETALYMLPTPLAAAERARRSGALPPDSEREVEAFIDEACLLDDDGSERGAANDRDRSGTRRPGVNYAGRGRPTSRQGADDGADGPVGALAALDARDRDRADDAEGSDR
jgi:hypothetical protein